MNDDHEWTINDESRGSRRRRDLTDAREPDDLVSLIDRLVSGDLDDARRTQLLAWLDEQPVRWRRCGLAFLEAQMWQQAFHELVHDSPRVNHEPHSTSLEVNDAARPKNSVRIPMSLVALAASMLFAFSLGALIGSSWQKQTDRLVRSPAAGQSSNLANSDRTERVQIDEADTPGSRPGSHDHLSSKLPHDRVPSSVAQAFAVLKLPAVASGDRELQLPLLEGQSIDERWLRSEPAELPEYVQVELERQGSQLRQSRRFMDVQLEDGRRAIVPVDQYQVSFVGHRSL